ncbi:MAG: sulfate transporter family protein [Alphaproteobacteria bacterium]|jgi:CysZ protein|nr:sulfate transporter family protein [Alphaproteobacteria bacterium]MBO6626918.1 sulfate transporter family protein [Alphaproteobacteria bacterium]MDF1627685.1 sulfate transporter family protein [Parvibaculaceae bacterium]
MFKSLSLGLSDTFSKPLRAVMLRSLGLSLMLLALSGVGAFYGLEYIPPIGANWGAPFIDTVIDWLSGAIVVVVLVLLLMPVSALFAGLFLEEVAGAVEARHYPEDTAGRDQPFVQGLWIALKFTGLLILLNILALPLYFIPIVNVVTYWGLNGYLLGREYFELVALRHRTPDDARTLRRQKKASVFFAGVGAAALASIPLVNLLTPFFATAMMVHLHKRFSEGPRSQKLG